MLFCVQDLHRTKADTLLQRYDVVRLVRRGQNLDPVLPEALVLLPVLVRVLQLALPVLVLARLEVLGPDLLLM